MIHRLMGMLDSPRTAQSKLNAAPIIYGIGNTGRKIHQALKVQGITPAAFIDRSARAGQDLEGIPVYLPDTPLTDRKSPVIIGVFNRDKDAYTPAIAEHLNELGYLSVIDFETFFQKHHTGLPESIFWLARPEFHLSHSTEIKDACDIWADPRSREIYITQMLHRMGEVFTILPEPDWGDAQYDPEDVPLLPAPYNFMDIGAYDGDTLESLRRRNKVLNKVVCFEPDMRNFRKLAERVSRNGPFAREIQLIPAAVGDVCQTLNFTADGTEAASFSAAGSVSVPAVSIDSVSYGFEPNYIKLDIEGHEESALKGLR
ncbi:MAG: FkbM family methyltransferase, partial [Victivallales bacterium]